MKTSSFIKVIICSFLVVSGHVFGQTESETWWRKSSETKLNYVRSSDAIQRGPSISIAGNRNFIITWQDTRNSISWRNADIYAQRYSSDGAALGSNFKVNDNAETTVGFQGGNPSISSDNNGNFVLTWGDERNGNYDIYAQRYANDGTALGSNFKVNDDQGSERQRTPCITADYSGNFIITWYDERNSMEDDIYAQRYSSDGTPLGSNFKVNDDSGITEQWKTAISADSSGNFIIVWEDRRNGIYNPDIYAQRYSRDGELLGTNFKVNDDQINTYQREPSISITGNGNFIITWDDDRNSIDGSTEACFWNTDIYAQRYLSDGTVVGNNFKVNDDSDCAFQWFPSISADESGNFIITWNDKRIICDDCSEIYAQRYSSDGTALGSNFIVNDDTTGWQDSPSISTDGSGNFIITWCDWSRDIGDVYAQRYLSDGTTIGSNFDVTDFIETLIENKSYKIHLSFDLYQNYPNPFNPSTTIDFTLPKSEFVTLKVYNMLGEEISSVVDDKLQAGNHTYELDGSKLASGIYLYRLEAGKFQDVKKMILLK